MLLPILAALIAQPTPETRGWNKPVEPFAVISNVHYVGTVEIASFLFTTPQGHILLDGGFVETAPQILANIRKLGFRPEDVKLLINSHAHYDHAGGLAELKRATGAQLLIMDGDAAQIARGGRGDFAFGDDLPFPPVQPRTPGHTRGCTSWTTTVSDHGRKLNVVFVCSTTAPGYRLKGNAAYPEIADDFRKSFHILDELPCDVFLAAHGSFFHLAEKMKHLRDGDPLAFVDPEGYRKFLAATRANFERQLREN